VKGTTGNESAPQHPSRNQTARGPDEVTASLATHGFAHYAPAFGDIGYDDLDYIKSLSPEERLQGTKRVRMLEGHAVRWARSLSGTAASLETEALALSAPVDGGMPRVCQQNSDQLPHPNDDEGEERVVLWFIKADKLRDCDDQKLPRFQDLQRQRPDWFEEKEITSEGACAHEYADKVLAVSHRWEQPDEPDTQGKQFAAMRAYVRGKPDIKHVWVDFSCAPQKERTPAEERVFERTLRFVNLLFLGSRVLILCDRTYVTRFWTLLEAWISMQMATIDGLVPAPREKRRCDIVPIHHASEVTVSELEAQVASKSLDELYAMLESPDIQVTNRKDKGQQLAKLLTLDDQVKRKMTLAVGAPRPSHGGAGVGTGADSPAPSKNERLKRLVEQVSNGSLDAAGALADMRENESRVAIARAGGIVPLVALLTAQDPAAGAEAARALRSLAINAENKKSIEQAGAFAPLVTLVQSGTDDQKEQAAGALRNLALRNAENQVLIAQAGAIAPLVTLVQSGTDGQKEQAAGALRNFAFKNAENQVLFAQAGAIVPLVTLVKSGTDSQKEYAADALRCLAYNNEENQVLIAQAGAIAPLVTLVQSGTDRQKDVAAGALFFLADIAENKVLIAQAGAITAPLVTLLSGTDGQKEKAAAALKNLAYNNAENQVLIAQAGAIAPLVTLVQSGTDRQKENAAGALRNLADIAENQVLIAQAGAITAPLVTLVQSGTDGQKENAAGALRNLADIAENQVLIAQAGAISEALALSAPGDGGMPRVCQHNSDQLPHPNDDEGEERVVLWFIKADKLRDCDDQKLPRFQDLQRQRPDWFEEKEITSEGACAHEYADKVLAVSHRWEQPDEPDTQGKQFAAMRAYVRGKPDIKHVWVDFSCAPQKERTPAEERVFERTLRFFSLLFLGSRVLILCDRTYTTRFWTLLEAWISMQMATIDGLVPAPREKRRCDIVPIHLASEVTASELETLVAGKSLDQLYAMLESPDIQVTNKKDKGQQLAKLLTLDDQVRPIVRKMAPLTLTLAGGAPRPSHGGAGVGTGADSPAPSKDERLQRLVQQVRNGSLDAAGALADMRENESRVAIARAGGIVPLVALLTAQDPAAGAEAARALRSLAINAENKKSIEQAGAIAPLVTLLKCGTDDQKEQAAGALRNLAVKNAENQVLIAQAGAIAPLVTLVQSGTDGQKENAAGALRNLAFIPENQEKIEQAGAIVPLVTLLKSGTDSQKEYAAGALRSLAAKNAENQEKIAQARAIAPLVTLVQSGTDRQKENAAGALRNLADIAENKVLIAQAGAITAPLVTLLKSGTGGQKEKAAAALKNLAYNNAKNQVLIAQAGAIAPLVTLVQSGTDRQKDYAAGALQNLALHAENQVLIKQAGA
jgi:vacuolar protein 8